MVKICMRLLFISVLFALVAGCVSSTSALFSKPKSNLEWINIVASASANQQSAIQVDVVFVYTDRLNSLLDQLSSAKWFQDKSTILSNNSDGVFVLSYEIVPLSKVVVNPKEKLRDMSFSSSSARGIYLFANYLNGTPNSVAEIGRFRRVRIDLDHAEIRVSELAKP